jgi:hypothetical protein
LELFAIKTTVSDPLAARWDFPRQKTMYGGKQIALGDLVFVFASENEGGAGLCACGVVSSAAAMPRQAGIARQTPRVSITVQRTGTAQRSLGRNELKPCDDGSGGGPQAELNFKLYRQATNKIVGLSEATGAFLRGFF